MEIVCVCEGRTYFVVIKTIQVEKENKMRENNESFCEICVRLVRVERPFCAGGHLELLMAKTFYPFVGN